MAGGRPPLGIKLVDGLGGSECARERLKVILETVAGSKSIESAAGELGIKKSRFHVIRTEMLEAARESLEPGPTGRPRKDSAGASADAYGALSRRCQELASRCQELEREATLWRVRERVHAAMPHLAGRASKRGAATTEKKTPRR